MNKVILGLILAVCVLGMALVMLNERLGRKPEPQQAASMPRIVTESEIGLEPSPAPEPSRARPGVETAEKEPAAEMRENRPGEMAAIAAMERPEAGESLAPSRNMEEIFELPEPLPEPRAMARPEPKPTRAEPRKSETPPKAAPQKAETPPKQDTKAPETRKRPGNAVKSITRFVVFAREKGATVRISGNGALRHKSMLLENPSRLVIDLDGDWKFPANMAVPKNELVNNVRVGDMGDKTRVVIDLKEKPRVSRVILAKSGDSIDVRLDK